LRENSLQLILPSNNLDGSLPDLTALNRLTTLIISNNAIQLPLPPLPPSLIKLDLSSSLQDPRSPLVVVIPDFSRLTRLTYLNLSNNSLWPPSAGLPSPLPYPITNLQILDLSNNAIADDETGAIPRWLFPDHLGDQILSVNLRVNWFCGYLDQDALPPATSSLQLDLRNNSFFCPLPNFNSSLVFADCESLVFRSISPTSGPTWNNQHDKQQPDTRLIRIYADGLSDYFECSNSILMRCRMSFFNSTDPDLIVYADWSQLESGCLKCTPPVTGVGLLKIVVELSTPDGDKSAAVSNVPFGFWLPVMESSVLYCQV
jgi:hypothetical protein